MVMMVPLPVQRLLLPFVCVVAALCWNWLLKRALRTNLGFFDDKLKNLNFFGEDEWKCTLLTTPTGVEGLSSLGDGHCVFGGGGDLAAAFARGAAAARPGAVWLFNSTARTKQNLKIDWRGKEPRKLVLHGIYFSQPSRRLYAVNHLERESVEV